MEHIDPEVELEWIRFCATGPLSRDEVDAWLCCKALEYSVNYFELTAWLVHAAKPVFREALEPAERGN